MWFWRGGVTSKHLLEGELEVLQKGGEAWQERGGEKMEEGGKGGFVTLKETMGIIKNFTGRSLSKLYLLRLTNKETDRCKCKLIHKPNKILEILNLRKSCKISKNDINTN